MGAGQDRRGALEHRQVQGLRGPLRITDSKIVMVNFVPSARCPLTGFKNRRWRDLVTGEILWENTTSAAPNA